MTVGIVSGRGRGRDQSGALGARGVLNFRWVFLMPRSAELQDHIVQASALTLSMSDALKREDRYRSRLDSRGLHRKNRHEVVIALGNPQYPKAVFTLDPLPIIHGSAVLTPPPRQIVRIFGFGWPVEHNVCEFGHIVPMYSAWFIYYAPGRHLSMGFNRRTMDDERRHEAEKQAAANGFWHCSFPQVPARNRVFDGLPAGAASCRSDHFLLGEHSSQKRSTKWVSPLSGLVPLWVFGSSTTWQPN